MYLTDLEETQWQVIKKILKPQERKRKYDLRKIWNAIFYVVKTGCQWRMLPSDLPSWELIYYYYHKWSSLGEFNLLLHCCPVKDGLISLQPFIYRTYRRFCFFSI
ncbi:transposase [uncultured Bacteroides sp.]|uniref:transposase n=1 Tax=uncultured Bacteroides sp. TaxID=162156 RepID=UPI002AAC33EB|nr:transposase [uncultured Bacteroides sp.]